jgi:arginyl-tRNA synthetase
MILAAMDRWGVPEPFTIEALNDLYVRFRKLIKEEPSAEEAGRAWFKRLEDGDGLARERWRRMREVSLAEFDRVYELLGVGFDEIRGESDYESAMPEVIRMLGEKGLATRSEGALVVDLSDKKMPPLLLEKADGATLYATRDLAAALYRFRTYQFDRCLYVVAREQALHFAQLFETLRRAGLEFADRMVHVGFGLVRIGGKKSGTRTGNRVLLLEVLDEAVGKVAEKLRETSPDLPPERAQAIARQVGIGAVVFANLASQRDKDVDFDLDEITSFEGDAGPYVQYAHARTAAILRRAGDDPMASLAAADPRRLERDEEWSLAKLLSDFPDEVARAVETCEPHGVARYLLDVCAAFSRWYTLGNQDPALKVLASDAETKRARLALTAVTQKTLARGLGLLGLAAPEAM